MPFAELHIHSVRLIYINFNRAMHADTEQNEWKMNDANVKLVFVCLLLQSYDVRIKLCVCVCTKSASYRMHACGGIKQFPFAHNNFVCRRLLHMHFSHWNELTLSTQYWINSILKSLFFRLQLPGCTSNKSSRDLFFFSVWRKQKKRAKQFHPNAIYNWTISMMMTTTI